ncbi:MAG: hypothetical protein H6Q77_1592, partial [Gemmatimonadetes bacterium]|nr:hypothetical protein [Gemmatimonadota bacterium]
MSNAPHHWHRGLAGRRLPLGWKQSLNYAEEGGPRFARHDAVLNADANGTARALHVATYNVELVKRPDAVLSLLEREPQLGGADILALQEADDAIVARAAERLGGHYVYYPSMLHPV